MDKARELYLKAANTGYAKLDTTRALTTLEVKGVTIDYVPGLLPG